VIFSHADDFLRLKVLGMAREGGDLEYREVFEYKLDSSWENNRGGKA
jgi:hypothetical protein